MGSKTSKANRPAPVKAKVVAVPRIPQDIVDEILDRLAAGSGSRYRSLRTCSLVSKSWVQPCRRHLFRSVTFLPGNMDRWFKAFPVPKEGPAHRVREIRAWIGFGGTTPEKFFEYLPWFTNVDRISFLGYGGGPLLRGPSSWRLPKSITSLTIDTGVVTLVQVRDIMAQLPNLDDLSLSGSFAAVHRRELLGIGTDLRGRFGGKLMLWGQYADEDTINMLLEIPSRLRFTEVRIYCARERLLSAVRLVEACCKTLVKLSHKVTFHRKLHSFC